MTDDFNDDSLKALIAQQAQALQTLATRPQKSFSQTDTFSRTRPYALSDMIANRDRIGQATSELNNALKAREGLGYTLASALAGVPQQQGYGSWLSDFARSFGGGMAAPTNAMVDRAQKKYEAEMKDLANILAYDKAMGETQNQHQTQTIDYKDLPYAGKGSGEEQTPPKVYDFTPVEMPETKPEWGELENQAVLRTDPQTGARTGLGIAAQYAAEQYNPKGYDAMTSNQTAYAKTFTTDRIAAIAKATGGSRGIDTMPEVTFKGGPELSANNMTSRKFEEAVRNRAWDAADQVIKANPRATITREELANAFINDFNHQIRKDYRVVDLLPSAQRPNAQQNQTPVSTDDLLNYYGINGLK